MIRQGSTMRRLLQITFSTTLVALAGCDESRPPMSPPPGGSGDRITGRERLGWTQAATGEDDPATYRYAVYVDGVRRVLEQEVCRGQASNAVATLECSAPLPPMSAGPHTLELAAFVTSGNTIIESARSAPLHVNITAATASVHGAASQTDRLVASDGLRLHVEILARDLTDPVDLAVATDDRVFVAEANGAVRIIGSEAGGATSAGQNVLMEMGAGDQARLLSIALAPDFADSGLLHVAYTTVTPEKHRLHIARLRERAGVLGQAAVTALHAVPRDVSASARFGPDGKLYVGVGTSADSEDAQNPAAVSGKILRLRDDGRTPDDNPSSSPVLSAGHRDPRGLAWHPMTGTLFEVEPDEVNVIRAGANYGWPIVRRGESYPGATPPVFLLPAGTDPSGVTTVTAETSPLFGDLIVAALGGEDLFRIRLDGEGRRQTSSRLLQRRFGRIAQVASGTRGALYAVTGNRETWGAGQDVLIRLVPLGDSRNDDQRSTSR